MNIKRILKLAEHLEKVPRKAFNQRKWCTTEPVTATTIKRGFECGTAACVAGHAVGVFPRLLGWKPTENEWDKLYMGTAYPYLRSNKNVIRGDALGFVLDICRECSARLTVENASHTTPTAAAKVLRKMVEGKWGNNVVECKCGVGNCR